MARSKFAMFLYFFALALTLAFAVTYLTKSEFMPYHAQALATDWKSLSEPEQVMFLGFMRVIGALALALTVLSVWVIFSAYRKGETWAFWAIPVTGNIAGIPTIYVMFTVITQTSGEPPIILPILGLLAFNLGLIVTCQRGRKRRVTS
ncbi:hypothetical protein CS022_05020 [Veronia nyctiphanis]|uniref:Uncharacterized protein n=1 Tax=Veronia nyctiphanis TaxID=1278244 RepID=A0A4Q0YSA5_9GAMM|nr:hypothetical protein [Veronia nyctiphanis]RXJ74016.1 hypothetical protein CS022_05020 [Veronia nyctiphanis]